ncbi:MAG: GAF domain-containing protein [Candidatus Eremiobacteraeota bacterium]|nr:GAF domain-containing protein [Candidatus Eremiobacteraeota bacterium]
MPSMKKNRTPLKGIVDASQFFIFQRHFFNITGLSLTVTDSAGKVIRKIPHPEDSAYLHIVGSRVFSKLLGSQVIEKFAMTPDYRPQEVIMGMRFLVVPIVFFGLPEGFLLAGPYKSDTLTEDNKSELAAAFKLHSNTVEAFTDKVPLLSPASLKLAGEVLLFLEESLKLIEEPGVTTLKIHRKASLLDDYISSASGEIDIDQSLNIILMQFLELFSAEVGSILLNDLHNEEKVISITCAAGQAVKKGTLTRKECDFLRNIIKTGTPGILSAGDITSPHFDYIKKAGCITVLCVPLAVEHHFVGVILVAARELWNFSARDLKFLSISAKTVAIAVNSAYHHASFARKVQELATIQSIESALCSTLDLEKVLSEVLKKSTKLLGAKKGSIMLIDDSGEYLKIAHAHGLSREIIENTRIKLGDGISGKVALEAQPRNLPQGVRTKDSKSGESKDIPAALSVPIIIKGKVIGVLNVSDRIEGDNFNAEDLGLLTLFASVAAIAIDNAKLHTDLHDMFSSSIRALINAIDARDPYTRGHSERVCHYAVKIGESLGLEKEFVQLLEYSAILHDIGKINISDNILLKEGKLTPPEWAKMKQHPVIATRIIDPVKSFRIAMPIIEHHHERYEGTGYPEKLIGEDIPLASRIIAVADSFDAMTSTRPYRRSMSREAAVQEIITNSGSQFDPKVVEAFLELLARGDLDEIYNAGLQGASSAEDGQE